MTVFIFKNSGSVLFDFLQKKLFPVIVLVEKWRFLTECLDEKWCSFMTAQALLTAAKTYIQKQNTFM